MWHWIGVTLLVLALTAMTLFLALCCAAAKTVGYDE